MADNKTKIKNHLRKEKLKLWLPPWYDPEQGAPNTGALEEKAREMLSTDPTLGGISEDEVMGVLVRFQETAVNKMAKRNATSERSSGAAAGKNYDSIVKTYCKENRVKLWLNPYTDDGGNAIQSSVDELANIIAKANNDEGALPAIVGYIEKLRSTSAAKMASKKQASQPPAPELAPAEAAVPPAENPAAPEAAPEAPVEVESTPLPVIVSAATSSTVKKYCKSNRIKLWEEPYTRDEAAVVEELSALGEKIARENGGSIEEFVQAIEDLRKTAAEKTKKKTGSEPAPTPVVAPAPSLDPTPAPFAMKEEEEPTIEVKRPVGLQIPDEKMDKLREQAESQKQKLQTIESQFESRAQEVSSSLNSVEERRRQASLEKKRTIEQKSQEEAQHVSKGKDYIEEQATEEMALKIKSGKSKDEAYAAAQKKKKEEREAQQAYNASLAKSQEARSIYHATQSNHFTIEQIVHKGLDIEFERQEQRRIEREKHFGNINAEQASVAQARREQENREYENLVMEILDAEDMEVAKMEMDSTTSGFQAEEERRIQKIVDDTIGVLKAKVEKFMPAERIPGDQRARYMRIRAEAVPSAAVEYQYNEEVRVGIENLWKSEEERIRLFIEQGREKKIDTSDKRAKTLAKTIKSAGSRAAVAAGVVFAK